MKQLTKHALIMIPVSARLQTPNGHVTLYQQYAEHSDCVPRDFRHIVSDEEDHPSFIQNAHLIIRNED